MQLLSEENKKKVWDWLFSFPFDEFAEKTKLALEVEFRGTPYYGNFFENNLSFYKKLPDKERQKLQKDWFKFISNMKQGEQTKVVLAYFIGKSKKWGKYFYDKDA